MTLVDLHLLVLILVANAAPIMANHLARGMPRQPVDAGLLFVDDQPLFGTSKTWRGILAAVVFTPLVAALLGVPWLLGLGMGLLAMLGDLLSSFIKRRMKLAPSSKAVLLDQIPESLLPAMLAWTWLDLHYSSILWIVFLFIIAELALSPLGYRLRIRKRPY